MVEERVLSQRELNRALLARQLLLERSPRPLTAVLEQMGGLQAQYAPSAYIGVWSRMADFPRESLTSALEARQVVQGTLIRSTIHLVSAGDYWLFAAGVREARRQWWLRVQRDVPGADMEQVAAMVRSRLEQGPERQAKLARLVQDAGYPRTAWIGLGLWLDMVRVPPSGTWQRRKADLYGLAEGWLGPCTAGESEGVEHLVRRYLGAFGPAPLRDIANWAGLPVGTVRPAVQRLDLRRLRDESGGLLLDLPDAPLPDAGTPAPVRFLPTWDATLLVHCRRTQILPERYRPLIFHTRTPHSTPVFLVDGAVAGTWRYEKDRVRLSPFETLPGKIQRELDEEAQALAHFHGASHSAGRSPR